MTIRVIALMAANDSNKTMNGRSFGFPVAMEDAQQSSSKGDNMKKSVQFAGILVGALAFTSLFGLSANAETRHQDESSWREGRRGEERRGDDRYDRDGRHGRDSRRDDRDFLSGTVERVDHRRGTVVLRVRNSNRRVIVEMTRRNTRGGLDLGDLRRGDYATFVGDWSRGGVFTSWRIDNVDSRGGRGRDRW